MASQLSKFEWAIGLHAQTEPPTLSSNVFASFYDAARGLFARLGVAMTHLAAEGKGYSGKLVKPNSAAMKHLVNSHFTGITALSCVVSPEGSKAPAYDRVVAASLSWNQGEMVLCVVVNEGLSMFLGPSFEATLSDMLEIKSWSFGYAFRDSVEHQPEFHVLSIDTGRLGKEEAQSLRRWYASKPSERTEKLRSVYPINILNEKQLGFKVHEETLAQFIERTPGTTLKRSGDLSIWHVSQDQLQNLRDLLNDAGATIA